MVKKPRGNCVVPMLERITHDPPPKYSPSRESLTHARLTTRIFQPALPVESSQLYCEQAYRLRSFARRGCTSLSPRDRGCS